MEKILTVNSRLSCSTFRDSFTNKGHLPYSKQQSGEDPNEAIFILKCEMDLSKSGSDHYCNPKLDVNVNRGKLPQGVVIQRHSGFDWMFNEFCLSD